MSKEEIKYLASALYFHLNENQLEKLYAEFSQLINKLDYLNKFDVSNIEPTNFPVCNSCNYLREDEYIKYPKNEYLKNAKNKDDQYVIVNNEIIG